MLVKKFYDLSLGFIYIAKIRFYNKVLIIRIYKYY